MATNLLWLGTNNEAQKALAPEVRTFLNIGNVENTALSTWTGSTSITTVGSITTGTWNGSTIAANRGGTGLSSFTAGNYLRAATASTLEQRTPAQVLADLGALAASSYTAADVLDKIKTVDGASSGLDADLLDGVEGANYTRSDLTNLGKTGNIALDSSTTTAAAWSALPVGYSRMFSNTVGTVGGAPVNNHGYFSKVANRDTAGGWVGLWLGHSAGQHFIGRALTNADMPTWEKIWTDGNDGAGSGLDADLLDGQHGSHYLAWANLTGKPTTLSGYGITDAVSTAALSTWTGSANITTVGTIATGTWQGSVIGPAYLGTGTRTGLKFLRDDGTWQTVSSGGGIAWSTVSNDNVTAVSNTGYIMETGGTLRTVTIPTNVTAGFTFTVNASGGQVRIVSNGNTIDAVGAGNDLLLNDGNTVTLVAKAAGSLEILYGGTSDLSLYIPKTGDTSVAGKLTFTGGAATVALDLNNRSIVNVDRLSFADPGINEGLEWLNGNGWKIFESDNALTGNTAGNLQFVSGGVRRGTIQHDGYIDASVGFSINGTPLSTGTKWTVLSVPMLPLMLAVDNAYIVTEVLDVTLPASVAATKFITVHATVNGVRIVANGNNFRGVPAGNDLVLDAGETAHLVASAPGMLEII